MRKLIFILSLFPFLSFVDPAICAGSAAPADTAPPATSASGSLSTSLTPAVTGAPRPDVSAIPAPSASPSLRANIATPPRPGRSMFAETVKMLTGLGITLALIYGAAFLVKRISGQRFMGITGSDSQIRIISTAVLPNKKTLHLVEAGGERFLIGAGDSGISLISRIEPESDFSTTLAKTTQPAGTAS